MKGVPMKGVLAKIGGFLLLLGLMFGAFVVVVIPIELWKKSSAESWPARKAVITQSSASYHRSTGRPAYYRPDICGIYIDNGEKFCVARIRYGGFRFGSGKADALQAVARYPAGRTVDVYHAPDNANETVLEAQSSWTEMFILFGLAITCLSIPFVLWFLRRKNRKQPQRGTDRD
jgi:hypothetical protein